MFGTNNVFVKGNLDIFLKSQIFAILNTSISLANELVFVAAWHITPFPFVAIQDDAISLLITIFLTRAIPVGVNSSTAITPGPRAIAGFVLVTNPQGRCCKTVNKP